MTYRVAEILGTPEVKTDDWHLAQAQAMQEKYGLYHLSLATIVLVWEAYSDTYAAGWLFDDKKSIESTFKVRLEENKE